MMTSFYNLLKYAATGIASPDMSYYDRMRASTLMGGVVRTLTGQPPLSFPSDGSPITIWSMIGNGEQPGTPAPDNIITPEMCGVLNENLAIIDTDSYSLNNWYYEDTRLTDLLAPGTYTISFVTDSITAGATTDGTIGIGTTSDYTEDVEWFTREAVGSMTTVTVTLTESKCIWARFVRDHNIVKITCSISVSQIRVEEGSTAYGYKLPLTNAGQTIPVYLGEVPTVRRVKKLVLTGKEQWQFFSDAIGAWQFYINDISLGGVAQSSCMSNIAPYGATATTRQRYDYGCYLVTAGNGVGFQMKGVKDTFTDIASWKSYLAAQYAAGTPVTIWYIMATEQTGIVNEPLCKIGTYADELRSEDAGVSIPTVKGQNTLTVDTPIQPSKMSITYRG